MKLLRITTPDAGLKDRIGTLPGGGAEHRLVLDPAFSPSAAALAVSHALRELRVPWVVVAGRAVAPFLAAVGADLSLAVAGALILSPAPWSPGKALDLSPLAFPAVLMADPEEVPRGQDLAQAWGARLLSARIAGPILSDPSVVDIITRRALSLSRA